MCDQCGKQITDPRMANVLYELPDFEQPGPWHSTAIYYTHKPCDHAFRQQHDTNWIDATDFVAQLCYHLGMEAVAKRIVGPMRKEPSAAVSRSERRPSREVNNGLPRKAGSDPPSAGSSAWEARSGDFTARDCV